MLLGVGCATDETLGETEQGLKSPGGDDSGCPTWGCGSNSPVMAAFEFWDLHELGSYNAQGFRITGFKKLVNQVWTSYRPDVIDGQLVARNSSNQIIHQGTALVGAKFEIFNRRTGQSFEMYVVEVDRTPLWIQPHPPRIPMAFTYRLKWKYANTATHAIDLCGASLENDGMDEFHAVLFDDDWIDADGIEVLGTHADWFNIGCRSHALAKQHLLGHTKAANTIAGITTTFGQRTANLKMLAADYCGHGDPFTVPGQPLYWHDVRNGYNTLPMPQPQSGGQIEARWRSTGAVCLDTPRVDYTWTLLGWQTFPNGVEPLLAPAAGWCTTTNPRPPPCTGSMLDMQGADIVSVNW